MAELSIRIDASRFNRVMHRLCEQMAEWPDEKCDRFMRGWHELEAHGAQCADFGTDSYTGEIRGWVSDDLKQYAKGWGVRL